MTRAIVLALALLGGLAAATPQALAQGCVGGREAQELIQQGQVAPFPEALRRAGFAPNELAGDPQLCQGGGGYVYRVRVMRDGQVSSVSIPAN
jgi:hypothetical protein